MEWAVTVFYHLEPLPTCGMHPMHKSEILKIAFPVHLFGLFSKTFSAFSASPSASKNLPQPCPQLT
jgi:hypothetical protein